MSRKKLDLYHEYLTEKELRKIKKEFNKEDNNLFNN